MKPSLAGQRRNDARPIAAARAMSAFPVGSGIIATMLAAIGITSEAVAATRSTHCPRMPFSSRAVACAALASCVASCAPNVDTLSMMA